MSAQPVGKLRILGAVFFGPRAEGSTVAELAERAGVSKSTAAKWARVLEAEGLVVSERLVLSPYAPRVYRLAPGVDDEKAGQDDAGQDDDGQVDTTTEAGRDGEEGVAYCAVCGGTLDVLPGVGYDERWICHCEDGGTPGA